MKQTLHLFVFDTLADWETGYAIAGSITPRLKRILDDIKSKQLV